MPTKCCFKGRGDVTLADYLAYGARTVGLMPVGNAPQFQVNATETTEDVRDFTSAVGGLHCQHREIQRVDVSLQLKCAYPRNMALAFYGTGSEDNVTTAVVVAEPHVAWPGATVPLDALPDRSVAYVVKSSDGETTYVAGEDYEVTTAGSIRILEGGDIPAPTVTSGVGQPNITVGYTKSTHTQIQLFNRPSAPVHLHFDGFNVMDGTPRPAYFDLYKVKFGPASSVALIDENSLTLQLTGTAECDKSRPLGTAADPLSQYGTLRY